MTRILIVEDDAGLNKGIALTLARDGMAVEQAYDLAGAEARLAAGGIDLVLLDVRLPDGSGLDFCAKLRETSRLPVIFLTANDMESDIVMGFELGGDDYITKPFSLMVLRSRVMAVLRRCDPEREDKVNIGALALDFGKMDYRKGGAPLSLSVTEQKLLRALVNHRGQILTRDQLIYLVWGQEAQFVDENALTVTIKRLRAKVEDDPSAPKWIKTVYGLGYVWTDAAEVQA
ncbi:response regulator transcription factor [Paenibacillus phocaensis]|uniref:response regulator transcription factor n=1 Tax=Paenibacillus phocaensis TaxID=1776378 RepID=UPI000839D3EF|nr:response regulator transcription factor [Paenibacillus phocaensis]